VAGPDDPAPAVWQPHTVRQFSGGRFEWDVNYTLQRLRIEAEGYVPVLTTWINKADGPRSITFRMERDPGIKGRVLTPGGDAAAGAVIALTMPNRSARLADGRIVGVDDPLPAKLSDRWRRPITVKADGEGRFSLPTESGPVMVYALHESGIAERPFGELRESAEIKLEAWGAVDGRVLWHDEHGADELLSLSIVREVDGYPDALSAYQEITTDRQGRFRIEKLPPWRVQLARVFRLGDGPAAGSFLFPYLHVELAAGRPTEVIFGGNGRPVAGKLTGLDSWDGVTLAIAPNAPRPADESGWRGHALVRRSNIGPLYFREKLKVKADGTFHIDGVLPASYQLFVASEDRSVYVVSPFRVEPLPGGESEEPHELGEIRVVRRGAR
jgi:hypothetical protein